MNDNRDTMNATDDFLHDASTLEKAEYVLSGFGYPIGRLIVSLVVVWFCGAVTS
jgi:hypothetical protein